MASLCNRAQRPVAANADQRSDFGEILLGKFSGRFQTDLCALITTDQRTAQPSRVALALPASGDRIGDDERFS